MRIRLTSLAFAFMTAVAFVAAEQGDAARTLMEAARKKEVVDGDLKGAIQQYQTITEKYKTDRAIVADALVRMADCYQKLGDAQAQKLYARVIHEYADQAGAAAIARAHVKGGEGDTRRADVTFRKLWASEADDVGSVSSDGRRVAYMEATHGHLTLHDLVDGTSRLLTNDAGTFFDVFSPTISRNNSQIAYASAHPTVEHRFVLRVSSLQGTGLPPSRQLLDREDVQFVEPRDWSPDGRWIAVVSRRKDRTHQIELVSVADGSARVLKSMDWRSPSTVLFSPDGRDLAFDLPVGETGDQRDVFVLAADGSRETPAVVNASNDTVMGWSPDGKQLLFASDRNGSIDLWSVAFEERKPRGPAELLKANLGNVKPLGISRTGGLYVAATTSDSDIEVASIDLATGRQIERPNRPIQSFVGSNGMPAWSRDGKYLAYTSVRPNAVVLGIRSLQTGETRELRPALRYVNSFSWAPDGGSFAVAGADARGRQGVYRVDARSGDVSTVVHTPAGKAFVSYGPQWSPDGRRLYYRRNLSVVDPAPQEGRAFYEMDLALDREREVARGLFGTISVSPDGKWIATTDQWTDRTGKAYAVLLVPVGGGQPRELLRVRDPQSFYVSPLAWAPNGSGVIVRKKLFDRGAASVGPSELLFVPISGGSPRPLNVDVNRSALGYSGVSVHPDGRRLAYPSGQQVREVWVLENFLPAVKTR